MLEVGKRVKVARIVIMSRAHAEVSVSLLGMGGTIIDSLEESPTTIFKWEVKLDNGKSYFFAAIELKLGEKREASIMGLEVGKRVRVVRVTWPAPDWHLEQAQLLKEQGAVGVVVAKWATAWAREWEIAFPGGYMLFSSDELEVMEESREQEDQLLATKALGPKETKYYVIRNDGGRGRITEETRDSLLALLEQGVLGSADNALPGLWVTWPGDWSDRYLIIKGEVVTPRVKETIAEFEIRERRIANEKHVTSTSNVWLEAGVAP